MKGDPLDRMITGDELYPLPVVPDVPDVPDMGTGSLLDDVAAFIDRYVAFPSEAALHAVVLWAAHCHVVDVFDSTPRLGLLSPEPGSGKTRVLEVLELLVPRPMHVLSASVAAVFRSIEANHPTLLFDEVDSIFGRHGKGDDSEDLRGLLNAGHRNGATIPRCTGATHDVRQFPVFGPVALAGLGDLPETLMSRSVIIRMRRRGPGETVQPFRRRIAERPGLDLADRLATWADTAVGQLEGAWPEMPDGVTDRPADVWEALLAIADQVGGPWPDRARRACVELCKINVTREASLGIRLLTDLKTVFRDEDHLSTEVILTRLHDLEESPWDDLRGKPLDARGLARRLGQYEIESTKVRIGDTTPRGYRREDLWDAWQRYCSPNPEQAEHPEHPEHGLDVPDVPHVPDVEPRGGDLT